MGARGEVPARAAARSPVEVELVSRVRAALVASTVVLGAALTGCAAQPGTAAVVDGRTVSQDSVNSVVAELTPLLGEAIPRDVLVSLMAAPLYIEAAEESGVGVSAVEIRDQLDQVALQVGAETEEWSDSTVELVRSSFAAQNLQGADPEAFAAVTDELLAADITVNPRYGRFDLEARQIVPVAAPWIVAGTGAEDATSDGTGPVQDSPTTE